jgi:hypothetical protein
MAYNRTHRAKRGEVGKVITITFYKEDGSKLNLTGYTAVWEVTAQDSATNVLEAGPAASTLTLSDQATNTGEATYTLTAADALIDAASYQWEARATHTGSGRVFVVPNVEGDEFGNRKWPLNRTRKARTYLQQSTGPTRAFILFPERKNGENFSIFIPEIAV